MSKNKINTSHLKELSERGRANYRAYWRPTTPDIDDLSFQDLPLMSVSDMVSYLSQKQPLTQEQFDELWKYVKEVLNDE